MDATGTQSSHSYWAIILDDVSQSEIQCRHDLMTELVREYSMRRHTLEMKWQRNAHETLSTELSRGRFANQVNSVSSIRKQGGFLGLLHLRMRKADCLEV